MFRLLTTATEEVHPFHITGHHFRWERFQEESPPLTVFGVGISERFNAYVEAAGGDAEQAGDYLYYNGTHRHFREGAWGILRVHDTLQGDLQPLPGHTPPLADGNFPHPSFPSLTVTGEPPPRAAAPGNPCPPDARQVSFDISAINHPELLNNDAMVSSAVDRRGRMYVLDDDVDAVLSGAKAAEPLVIRANTGDCITVKLTNRLTNRHASFHVDSPTFDAQGSLGITLGFNPDQTVVPGGTMTYRYYAARDLGDDLGVVLIRDFGDALRNGPRGLYGALVIEPEGSTYHDPYTGTPLTSGVAAVIQHPDQPDFREFVTVFHDADPEIGTFNMPYDAAVDKMTLVNYRAEPLAHRLQKLMPVDTAPVTYDTGEVVNTDAVESVNYDPGNGAGYQPPPAFYVKQQIDDLETARGLFREDFIAEGIQTDIFEAYAGDPVRFRVVSGFSEQPQVFTVEGHQWPLTPRIAGSDIVSSRYLPSTGVLNAELASTGGPQERPGDYLWGNHRLPYLESGQWGLFRVLDPARTAHRDAGTLLPLADRP